MKLIKKETIMSYLALAAMLLIVMLFMTQYQRHEENELNERFQSCRPVLIYKSQQEGLGQPLCRILIPIYFIDFLNGFAVNFIAFHQFLHTKIHAFLHMFLAQSLTLLKLFQGKVFIVLGLPGQ